MARISAAFPWKNGRPPHLPCGPGDIAENVLTPGDPDRVRLLADMLEDVQDFGRKREFAVITGMFEGKRLTICSTGIGGPSTEIALVELAMLGAKRVIRIGGMSALVEKYSVGSFIAVDKAIGDTGTAMTYRIAGGEAKASPQITQSLVAAAAELGLACRPGMVASTDSYYFGQDRRYRPLDDGVDISTHFIDRFQAQGAVGVEMESEITLTVGGAIGLDTGCLLGVHGNRATGDWLEDYEATQRNLLRIAGRAFSSTKMGT
ncbi:nucleoside phosphorylase [Rhizobium leguminosarum]|uniref:nucleoside phosphorylase n=1 Tax=Rhizobium leguminosarum TaxID=384 RepID=UPI001C954433|nr:nucleoside phosphorylase [Rhizobium leguminosarum]MBY5361832.1 nucleoside phosphorylase [Rhizobium leguminosarum]MBY5664861.1 nucleoside phosphorylase [Rhizobium leguminosarum]MBY5677655.1 nucleoside phosphorylase [Rhizobium leguminosarum]MBY5720872.1 nucleoside phosphorylase [Rhizobium leguminosarum]